MSFTLYSHPLASFCWKPLIALYETKVPFTKVLVDLGDQKSSEGFHKVWAMGEFPVLRDETHGKVIPLSAPIIEYLALHAKSSARMIPADADVALEARRWNDFYDAYVQTPMQKIVGDCLRPDDGKDPIGVNEARDILRTAYEVLETHLKGKTWMVGGEFSLADCAAAPALYYANKVEPFTSAHPLLNAYLKPLEERPSFARVLEEAKPYFHFFPYKHSE